MNTFDLKRYLTENKLTYNSKRSLKEEYYELQDHPVWEQVPTMTVEFALELVFSYIDEEHGAHAYMQPYEDDPEDGEAYFEASPLPDPQEWDETIAREILVEFHMLDRKGFFYSNDPFNKYPEVEELTDEYVRRFLTVTQTPQFYNTYTEYMKDSTTDWRDSQSDFDF
jgi:hypothetical protein